MLPPAVPYALVLGLALLVLRQPEHPTERPEPSALPGIHLTERQRRFVDALEDAAGVRVVVTSATRTAARQAVAMLRKLRRGEDLHELYRDDELIDVLLAGPQTEAAWTAHLKAFAALGRHVSRHQSGDAIDIRTRTLSSEETARIAWAARSLGARALIESDHMHISRLGLRTNGV